MEYKKNIKRFSLTEKKAIAELALANKKKVEEEQCNMKPYYNEKKKKWVKPQTQVGYKAKTVREYFVDLETEPNDSQDFKNAVKLVDRCVALLEANEFEKEGNQCRQKFRVMGAGPPQRAAEVRYALFDYFVDIRKGRLSKKFLLVKAQSLYETWCEDVRRKGEEPAYMTFSKTWLKVGGSVDF